MEVWALSGQTEFVDALYEVGVQLADGVLTTLPDPIVDRIRSGVQKLSDENVLGPSGESDTNSGRDAVQREIHRRDIE